MRVDPGVQAEQAWWDDPETEAYYRSHRNTPEQLYESERHFLPSLIAHAESMLDVGCAAGGFSRIARAFNPGIRYVGIDITPGLVDAAQRDNPGVEFHMSDGLSIPFDAGSFDLVHCAGVLHLNSRYGDMIREMWRVTKRDLVYDVRLTEGPASVGTLTGGAADRSAAPLPYHVLNLSDHLANLHRLAPPPAAIRAFGYVHAPAEGTRVSVERIIMAVFALAKNSSGGDPVVDLRFER